MGRFASWIPGILLVGLASVGTITLLTAPTRSGLRELHAEAEELSKREATHLKRLIGLRALTNGGADLQTDAVWTSGDAPSVEVALQQALVTVAADSELQLVSFAEAAPVAEVSLPTIANELELAGTHEGLARLLASLEAMQPPLAISFLWLRQLPPDPSRSGAPVSIRLTVWGFREGPKVP